jgi:Protein of unknown function (DUF3306)
MLKRVRLSALILGLVLAGPAVANDQFIPGHRAALVEIDALTAESDFTIFMHEDVPEGVRRVALRRLWVLMNLPVSCDDLCTEPQPADSGFVRLASEKLHVTAQ